MDSSDRHDDCMSIFTGLSAFPLTPLVDGSIDERSFDHLIARLVDAEVDSITTLGSTGSYAYLSRDERALVARRAVRAAGDVPVFVGIGALSTRHVLEHAEDAQNAGAQGLLLAPVSYQVLTRDEVYGLFETVAARSDAPIIVYDNPVATRFAFDDDLYAAVAGLPGVASIKIPGASADPEVARARVTHLRGLLPSDVTIGVSRDAFAAAALNAGYDAWYSVVGGTLPRLALRLADAALNGDSLRALDCSAELQPLWDWFARDGSLRVIAAVAEHLQLVPSESLPLPILGLDAEQRAQMIPTLEALVAAESAAPRGRRRSIQG